MHRFQKFISGMLTLTSALTMSGLGMVTTAYGAQLQTASVTLSNPVATENSNYTVSFLTTSTNGLKDIRLVIANTASGSVAPTGSLIPDAVTVTAAAGAMNGEDITEWTATKDSANTMHLRHSSTSPASAGTFTFTVQNVANNTAVATGNPNQCDAVNDTEGCWVRVETSTTAGGATLDSTSINYMVVTAISATATVDPILTMTIGAVVGGSVTTNDAGATASSYVGTQSTSIPFGNVTVGSSKAAQQSISVLTNAFGGYYVYHSFTTTNMMVGSANAANNIDPAPGDFTTAVEWGTPSGNVANTNTAWLGMRCKNANGTACGAFSTANYWAGPLVNPSGGTGANIVMRRVAYTGAAGTGPDDGTTLSYVSYKLQANAFQPADTYSGNMRYNAVVTY
jgi:hypothetical protein